MPEMKRILLIRMGHIGEVVLGTASIELIHQLYPTAEIAMLVREGTESVLENHPWLKRIYTAGKIKSGAGMNRGAKDPFWRKLREIRKTWQLARELRSQKFDLAICFSGGDRGAILAFLSRAKVRIGIGPLRRRLKLRHRLFTHVYRRTKTAEHIVIKDLKLIREAVAAVNGDVPAAGDPCSPRLYPSSADRAWAEERWRTAFPSATARIVIHPASRAAHKCWASDNWVHIIDRLHARFGPGIMLTCGPEPNEVAMTSAIAEACREKPLLHAGDLTLSRLSELIRNADIFLGVDCAAMHIAAAAGTRVVAVFGPSDDRYWGPWGTGDQVIRKPCPCLEGERAACCLAGDANA